MMELRCCYITDNTELGSGRKILPAGDLEVHILEFFS